MLHFKGKEHFKQTDKNNQLRQMRICIKSNNALTFYSLNEYKLNDTKVSKKGC